MGGVVGRAYGALNKDLVENYNYGLLRSGSSGIRTIKGD